MEAVRLIPCADENTQHEPAALVLLLRYSWLRFGDAVQFHESRRSGQRVLLYTAKTGVPVYLPLPDFVIYRLTFVRRPNGYFFATGKATVDSHHRILDRNDQYDRHICL